jgi:monoamine oxidase
MTVAHGVGPNGVAPPGSSGIQVIIVGLGIAGLVAAIECHYKGHVVVGLERSPGIRVLGELYDTKSVVHGSFIDWSRR